MNLQESAKATADGLTADQLATHKFAVGQSVPRVEDPQLLRGKGRYTDDVSLPGQAYVVMVRSRNRPRHDPWHRYGGGAENAGRARRLYRRRT